MSIRSTVTSRSTDPWLRTVDSTDVDEHASAQLRWSLHYEQLSPGSFDGKFTHLQLPGVRVIIERTNRAVRQRGSIGDGHYGFAMTVDQRGDAFFNGQRVDCQTLMMGRAEELDLSSPARFCMVGIVVDGHLLDSLWQRMYQKPLAAWLDMQVVVRMRPEAADELRTTHFSLLRQLLSTPALLTDRLTALQMRDAILTEWIEAIPARVDTSPLKSAEARKRVVDRACEVMMSGLEEPLSTLQVCNLVGASPRKLEYCFRDVLGISPIKYLRAVRLNGVRRDLKQRSDARAGVRDVAAQWGFWHFGGFSAAYKRHFGELPSETLHHSRMNLASSQTSRLRNALCPRA
jgi:AraC family transcriptional regulator, ethanolamine operon transcriptional activator